MYNARADLFYCLVNLLSGHFLVVQTAQTPYCAQSSYVLKSNIPLSFQVKREMFTSVPRSLSVL